MVAAKRLQGIFCSTRDDLPDTVEGVFEALVKKVLDIDHSRGIVMGASSDIDHLVNACLEAKYDQCDDTGRKTALGHVAKRAEEKRKEFEKDIDKVRGVASIKELFELHQVYTSADRLRLLRKILEAGGAHVENCNAILAYEQGTVPKRNDLAHVRVKRVGFSRKLLNRKGVEYTTAEMRELRLSLVRDQEVFEKLAEELGCLLDEDQR